MADLDLLVIREAIVSVCMSHVDDCTCTTCRAAHGDSEAFAQVVIAVRNKKED